MGKNLHHLETFYGTSSHEGWASGEMVDATANDVNLLGLPLFHNYGAIAIGLASWVSGTTLVMATPQGFRGEGVVPNLWQILDHYNVRSLVVYPTTFGSIMGARFHAKRSPLASTVAGAIWS